MAVTTPGLRRLLLVGTLLAAGCVPEENSPLRHPDDIKAICAAYDQASVIARVDTLPAEAQTDHQITRQICDSASEPDPYAPGA